MEVSPVLNDAIQRPIEVGDYVVHFNKGPYKSLRSELAVVAGITPAGWLRLVNIEGKKSLCQITSYCVIVEPESLYMWQLREFKKVLGN